MGSLHQGHLALVHRAREVSDRVCVSVFVNPQQFSPNEDFASYPRDEIGDAAKLKAAGTHLLFAPDISEMYVKGHLTRVSVPNLGDKLEGIFRPHFVTGVATVVTKLLLLCTPDIALFGEKDYQQLLIIRRLVSDFSLPVTIEPVMTIRESDGLALSSRNVNLAPEERRVAPMLYKTINSVATKMKAGASSSEQICWAKDELLTAGFANVDYISVCDAETLEPLEKLERTARVLAAAWLGQIRLIDNVLV